MLLVITIPRITVVYSFIVKLLLTTLTPLPPSPSVHTRKWKVQCQSLRLLEKGMRWPFQASPNNTKETRREKKRKNQFN